ncbi:hypothetical protein JL720_12889 [Aureococcus anophagefferens]|nr:hypothetical protein JL720_12889 [Aureococcus anophagefferens]
MGGLPETYKNAEGSELCVETEEEQQAKAASALVGIFEKRVAARGDRCLHPKDLNHVSVAQLDFEYDYIRARLFGEPIGVNLYNPDHEEFDEVYTDSVDEISMLWLEVYKRYDREPRYRSWSRVPDEGRVKAKRQKIEDALERAYDRPDGGRRARGRAQARDGVFLSCPKGVSRAHNDRLAAEAAAARPPPAVGPVDNEPVIVPVPIDDQAG